MLTVNHLYRDGGLVDKTACRLGPLCTEQIGQPALLGSSSARNQQMTYEPKHPKAGETAQN